MIRKASPGPWRCADRARGGGFRIASTRDFVESTYLPAKQVAARGGSLKDAWDAVREACDPKFKDYAIYEHCLPFNVSRAYDEARGIDTPRIWTAERDVAMWEALQD